jgi:hypothetical protein
MDFLSRKVDTEMIKIDDLIGPTNHTELDRFSELFDIIIA